MLGLTACPAAQGGSGAGNLAPWVDGCLCVLASSVSLPGSFEDPVLTEGEHCGPLIHTSAPGVRVPLVVRDSLGRVPGVLCPVTKWFLNSRPMILLNQLPCEFQY